MSLKNKILMSFMATGVIVIFLSAIEYANFIKIKNEIAYLETTDTIRGKCLQLRRHEKNFFLYGSSEADDESRLVYHYLNDLNEILFQQLAINKKESLSTLHELVRQYEVVFTKIESSVNILKRQISLTNMDKGLISLIESTFTDIPLKAGEFLEKTAVLSPKDSLVMGLKTLDADIYTLRKIGENIVNSANELDRAARGKVDGAVRTSQLAILVLLPLFFVVGLGMLFIISNNLANRLNRLVKIVENAGKGFFMSGSRPESEMLHDRDELGILFQKFYEMENQITQREKELQIKSEELLQSRKLAAIGTLASGVAHELNNPLNNIYLSAQVLLREIGDSASPFLRKITEDVLGQTKRVKFIIGDLLEFARGRKIVAVNVDVYSLIDNAYKQIAFVVDVKQIEFELEGDNAVIFVDSEQIERVFINLFLNAVEAMENRGVLSVSVENVDGMVKIRISDTGGGIPMEDVEKIFEPFFTTKDKGTGLGLAIVYNIVKKHDGDLKVESEPGRSTTFVITLPTGGQKSET
ncbi:sensor histidine kinase [Candidatus Magnetominusculus dajiuhuensis]|uniref:sensor histidine kinase n=1 Tax=Candidatus Magnetominusculus dajiuhuensis TaxID=3137712 RepID=UPI003B4343CA